MPRRYGPIREVADVEKPSKAWARRRGWYVRKLSSPAHRSVPDDLFVKQSRVVFVEFKAPGKPLSEQQGLEHRELREAGAEVYTIDSFDDFVFLFEQIESELARRPH